MIEPSTLMALMRIYLEANLLLAVAFATMRIAQRVAAWTGAGGSHGAWLRLGQVLVVLALVLPVLSAILPTQVLLEPSAQIWSGDAIGRQSDAGAVIGGVVASTPGEARPELRLRMWWLELGGAGIAAGILLALGRLAGQLRRLRRTLASMPSIRRIGRVTVLAADDAAVPYSAWLPGRSWVVIPAPMIGEPERLRIAVAHELQHHRQGDTRWLHLVATVRAVCFWNPSIYAWSRWSAQAQEFACDEHLVGRRSISPQAYGRCLLETARDALRARRVLAGTASMASASGGEILKRRVEMLFVERKTGRQWRTSIIAVFAVLLLSSAAFASRSAVQDRTIDLPQANALAANVQSGTIPVVVDEQVLAKLNRYAGTPKGREFMQNALKRMPEHMAVIEQKLAAHGLPKELLAVALLESGFKNMPETSTEPSLAPGMRGAGIWMFIPQTARNYGLTVNGKIDERLDVEKETEAACLYFSKLYKEFGDWYLALAAYNMGEKAVNQVLQESGTRDAMQLVRDGKLNDYLPTWMASLIILRNPSSVD